MICFLPVHQGDISLLRNLLIWIGQLGGCNGHRAVIVADAGASSVGIFDAQIEASKSFSEVSIVCNSNSVTGWIEGANSLFLTAAEHAKQLGSPWLFLEPDAVPLVPGWLDKIEISYRASGSKYMGVLVKCSDARLPPVHLPGVSIYPSNAYDELSPIILSKPAQAFDISIADVTSKSATSSDLFQHLWGEFAKPPTFSHTPEPKKGIFGLNYIKDKSAIFHRNKDGTLIDLLRERAGIKTRAFIQLGRFGDIILLLPALKHISDTSGSKPVLICSTDYASVLDGVSYVSPYPMKVSWYHGMTEAIQHGRDRFGDVTVLQCHAKDWGVDIRKWPNFMTSMWDRTGVPISLMPSLPLIFDRRSMQRELTYAHASNGKQYIVINTAGVSSPFPYKKNLVSALAHLKPKLDIVDIGQITCHRIYDLLGLMDNAVGGIHIDTATLHLAKACLNPYIALTVDGWCSSVPGGNCVMEVKYSQFMNSLSRIAKTVESWL